MARRRLFSAAHLYEQPLFSHEQNIENFGACYSTHGHGHNYTLELFIEGSIDPMTGMVIDIRELDQVLKVITEPLDHHHLNFDVSEFHSRPNSASTSTGDRGPAPTRAPVLVPTTENIALYLLEKAQPLVAALGGVSISGLRLYETDDLWVELWVEPCVEHWVKSATGSKSRGAAELGDLSDGN
jgi:6-pyruvoyltetrahydropterin/6-carboxytetrahydropterin synthase